LAGKGTGIGPPYLQGEVELVAKLSTKVFVSLGGWASQLMVQMGGGQAGPAAFCPGLGNQKQGH
jgi:hypothetical protein